MAGGQWEVVGGKAKKPKNTKKEVKKEEKSNGVSTFVTAGPISESKTVFNAFLEKEKKEQPPKQQKSNEPAKSKEKSGPHKKKVDKKAPAAKTSLEDLCSSISEDDVKNHLATLEVLLPNSPLLWLKDLATFFNVKLDIAIDAAAWTSKPAGYPCSLLKKGVYKHIVKTYNRCAPQTLQIFHEFCLNGLVQDGLKGQHIVGYITVLQCLAQEMPTVMSSNFSKYSELCNAHSNRQNICLLLWWIAGQIGNKDLETGFQIWLQLMFPMIGEKNCPSYALEYVEELVSKVNKTGFKKNIIHVRDFFPILDFIHSKELPKGAQKRLMTVYPTLKLLSYGCEPENILRNYFPSYLRRLEPQCSQLLKSEILSSLVYCLGKDARCFSVWRQLYTKHFVQSKLFIAHLNEQWDVLPSSLPRKPLRETLSVFQVTNEELMSSSKKSNDVEECSLINKDLLTKLNSSRVSWLRVIGVFILLISTLLIADVGIHGTFNKSLTGKFMKDTGLIVVCNQVAEKLTYFYKRILKLLEIYTPAIFEWYHSTFLPYVELFMKELSHIMYNMWNSTSTLRRWCNEQFPPMLETIEKQIPYLKENLSVLLKNLSSFVLQYLSLLWNFAGDITLSIQSNDHIIYMWEEISTYSAIAARGIQQYATSLLHYMQPYIPWSTN